MAAVAGDQNFVFGLAGDEQLAVGQAAVFQARINADLVSPFFQLEEIVIRETEAPVFPVVRGAVGDQVWLVGKGEEVRFEFFQRHGAVDGHAVIQNMQAVLLEVNDFFAMFVHDVGITDVPFAGNGPVEDLGAGGNFV